MNLSSRVYKLVALSMAVLMLCGVSKMQQLLNKDRQVLGLTKLPPLQNAPPMLAFTTGALGGFRGLIANALWMRSLELQDQEKYFEMVQLADWITELEPHYVQVWCNEAWNMGFNITVKFSDFPDRWRWLKSGINLLHKGLKYNPDEPLIYRELSWFFQFKLGANMDDAHKYYKAMWFGEMQDLFQGKPNFDKLINPVTPEEVRRTYILTNVYGMDPAIMREVDQEYGPLEWRLPDAHGVYWGELGRRRFVGKPKDKQMCRRSIYQCLQQACLQGHLTFVGTNPPFPSPNYEIVDKANAAYEKLEAENALEDPAIAANTENGHRGFVEQMVFMLYCDGREAQAQKLFDWLRTKYPKVVPANYTMKDYALERLSVQLNETESKKMTDGILGILRQGYETIARAEDDSESKAETLFGLAQVVWENYHERAKGGQRTELPALDLLKQAALDQVLRKYDSTTPMISAILRTRLHLEPPAPRPADTNAPAK